MSQMTAIYIDPVVKAYIEERRANRYETANEILRRILGVDEVPVPKPEELARHKHVQEKIQIAVPARPEAGARPQKAFRRSPSRPS